MPHALAARNTAAIALLAILAAAGLSAQSVPTLELAKRTARSKYTFGQLFSLQELPDGRVVASDSKEAAFRVVDFAKGDMALLGTQGDDPENYRSARTVLKLPGDSLLLYDALGRQFIRVSPGGQIAGFSKLPTTAGPNRPGGNLIAADASGALYFAAGVEFDSATKTLKTTAAIRRLPAGSDATEDFVRISTRRPDQTIMNGIAPYLYRDAWALRSDGLTARVVADTYQVIWSRDGKETGRTGPISYQPIPLTLAEQQAFHDSIIAGLQAQAQLANAAKTGDAGASGAPPIAAASGGATIGFVGGAGTGSMTITRMDGGAPAAGGAPITMTCTAGGCVPAGAPAPGGMTINPANVTIGTFPENKPPIIGTATAALFDPNGFLWITRERAHTDPVPHIDIVAEGRGVIAHVNLPEKTRLAGFGKGVVYLAHLDGQEEYLERYPLPKF